MPWNDWWTSFCESKKIGRHRTVLPELNQDYTPVPACKPPAPPSPFALPKNEQYLRLVDEHYAETLELIGENQKLLQAVRRLFEGAGEQSNFNAGLQVGAMLARSRSDAVGAGT